MRFGRAIILLTLINRSLDIEQGEIGVPFRRGDELPGTSRRYRWVY